MKRFGATTFFGGIVAILIAFTTYDYWSSLKSSERRDEDAKVVQLKKSELTEIEIKSATEIKKFKKADGVWKIESPIKETADQQTVLTLIESLTSEKIIETVKEGDGQSAFDLNVYGLATPLFEVMLKAGPANETLKVGTVKAFEGSLYGQINDQKKVVLFSSAWDLLLTKPIKDFRDKRLYRGAIDTEFDHITSETNGATGSQDHRFTLVRKGPTWALQSNRPTDALDSENVKAWLEQIKSLRGIDYVEPPAVFGKGQTVETTKLTLTTEKQAPFTLIVSRSKANFDDFQAQSSDLSGGLTAHVSISKESAESARLQQDAFYNRMAPFKFNPKDVARVVFDDPKTKKHLDTKVDPTKPDVLMERLKSLEAVRFLGPADHAVKPSSSLRLYNSAGGLVFELAWGEPVIETATADRPEARYLQVRTNLSTQLIGVAEKQIEDLIK